VSKNRNISPSADFGDSPPDVESLLKLAAPEDVALDRDVLMFQTGMRAVSKRCASDLLWPAVAAALLIACGGVSVALVNEIHRSSALESSLAKLERLEQGKAAIATRAQSGALTAVATDESPSDMSMDRAQAEHLRNWGILSSTTRLPAGQLTAAGWERSTDSGLAPSNVSSPPSDAGGNIPRTPATYLELLRSYQEG
jgi:hypothetical protein